MQGAFYTFAGSFIISTIFVAPFLQREKPKVDTADTKQVIRTLFESVSPKILEKIDIGQKNILILINIPTEIKLLDLPQHSDFNKFLSFEQNHEPNETDEYIYDSNDHSWKAAYRIYPKDALIK